MQTKLIVFKDYQNREYLKLTAEDNIDMEKALESAIEEATQDNIPVKASEIPEKYLQKYGLVKEVLEIITMEQRILGQPQYERAGIEIARCRHCSGFEEGLCLRYGGTTDPNDGDNDCIHGICIYRLSYDGERVLDIYNGEDYEIERVIELLSELECIRKYMDQEDYDETLWKMEERD